MSSEQDQQITEREGLQQIDSILRNYQELASKWDSLHGVLLPWWRLSWKEKRQFLLEERRKKDTQNEEFGQLNIQKRNLECQFEKELVTLIQGSAADLQPGETRRSPIKDEDRVISEFPDFISDFLKRNQEQGQNNTVEITRFSRELIFGIGTGRKIVVYLHPEGSSYGLNCFHWFGTLNDLDDKHEEKMRKLWTWRTDEDASTTLERFKLWTQIAKVLNKQFRSVSAS